MSHIDLLPGQAHVWTVPLEVLPRDAGAPDGDRSFELLETVLSADEVERSKRFHYENNRREYIAAHALCRVMLSTFAKTPPGDWRFEAGAHGRPEITGPGDDDGLRFNISHTRGMVCAAVTRIDDIGVDVEWMGRDNLLDEIARAKFSIPEVARFDAVPETEKPRCFFSFWTLKESYIKAIGKGLREPLDGFAFTLDPLTIEFLKAQDDPLNWRFLSVEPTPEYLCALAVRREGGRELEIKQRVIDIQELINLVGKGENSND